jgi:hypothetical protein
VTFQSSQPLQPHTLSLHLHSIITPTLYYYTLYSIITPYTLSSQPYTLESSQPHIHHAAPSPPHTRPYSFDQLVCIAPFAHLLVSYTSCYSCDININSCIGTNLKTVTHNSNAGMDELMTQVNKFKKKIKADTKE